MEVDLRTFCLSFVWVIVHFYLPDGGESEKQHCWILKEEELGCATPNFN